MNTARSAATAAAPRFASVVFDADSTLSAIEGIDWLAQLRSPGIATEVAALTDRAMNGEVGIEEVYALRIARIRPTHEEIARLAHEYIANLAPGAKSLFSALHSAGVHTAIMSGGIRDALLPMASELRLPHERVFAVSLQKDRDAGAFTGVEPHQPLTTQFGKLQVLEALIAYAQLPTPVAFVGDGATDAAVHHVAHFIAYTGVARRPSVVAVARDEVSDMAALQQLLLPE